MIAQGAVREARTMSLTPTIVALTPLASQRELVEARVAATSALLVAQGIDAAAIDVAPVEAVSIQAWTKRHPHNQPASGSGAIVVECV